MRQEIIIKSLAGIDEAAEEFIFRTHGRHLIAFHAPMGAGKTTFTTALCRCLGVNPDEVGSPTFSIVNEYLTSNGDSLYHFDFYRINRPEEALDIGIYDYLDSGYLCLMEWPENVAELLPEETLDVFIDVQDDGTRIISWEE